MILTTRLQLIPVEREHIDAFHEGNSSMAALLNVSIPEGWPHFPHAFAVPPDDHPAFLRSPVHWHGYLFINVASRALVGNGGFKGPPNADGIVEIGYEIAPEYQNLGFASEAAAGLMSFAFTHESVTAVTAHTLGEINASNRVLQKIGMDRFSEAEHPSYGLLWGWHRLRTGQTADADKGAS